MGIYLLETEYLLLLGVEFLLGQNTLILELTELLELSHLLVYIAGGGGGLCGLGCLIIGGLSGSITRHGRANHGACH
jgi:hypothetical protein